jgi:nucleotide-binding universal stress UspA family protein
MFKRILIAYDGSAHSQRAAKLAGELARKENQAQVWLVCVMEAIPKYLGEPYVQDLITAQTYAGDKLLKDACKIMGSDIKVNEELLFGKPAESILSVAESNGCDLIIMGTRGLSVLQGLLLGSQAHRVICHAKCPVLAVK